MTILSKIYHFFCADLVEIGAIGSTSEDIISRMAKNNSTLHNYDAPYAIVIGKVLSKKDNL